MSVFRKTVKQNAAGLLFALLLVVASVFSVPTASAVDADGVESITLSPVNTRFTIDAGSTRQEELTILNDGDIDYDLIVYARPYSVKGQGYDPDFVGTPSNADAYQWVQFQQTNWRVKAGETLKIPYTIRVPASATPGGHYGVVFAETQPKQADGTSVARKKRVGSIIYATVNGTYTTGGNDLGITIPPVQFRAPLVADLIIENTGNADFEVKTTYRITDLFGNTKYEVKKDHIVLPKTARKMNLEWTNAPWFGLFNVSVEATFLDKVAKSQSMVLLIPRWVLVVLGVAVVGGGVYGALRYRRR